jgi:DNA-binding transcriptional LysR family regulator
MLPPFNFRDMYAAVILAEELNFTRAAHRLQITQPALSKRIIDLERQHGFKLFLRDRKRPAQLTEAGRAFVQQARAALLHADCASLLARAVHHASQADQDSHLHGNEQILYIQNSRDSGIS